jgi:hypothetical protein
MKPRKIVTFFKIKDLEIIGNPRSVSQVHDFFLRRTLDIIVIERFFEMSWSAVNLVYILNGYFFWFCPRYGVDRSTQASDDDRLF